MQSERPSRPIVLTMGDPAGVGPEIIAKALMQRPEWGQRVLVAGDVPSLKRAQALLGAGPEWVEVSDLNAWLHVPVGAPVVIQACALHEPVPWGGISASAGRAAADCIAWGATAVLAGRARALVTAPIHKEALHAAGVPYPGHTEMLQALSAAYAGVSSDRMPVRMMLSAPGLRTVLVSIHVALREAIAAVTFDQVLETLRITADYFARHGLPQARIAVAGLNPHAGEGGLFGREELEVIAPAIAAGRDLGWNVSGPYAPDTVFMRARQGAFDAVVAMYHDQGLIPVKLMGLEHGVNTTLGLPLIRTSPDHGTAFDLAGTGQASAASLLAALDEAWQTAARSPGPGEL